MEELIIQLREKSGCSVRMCRDALEYGEKDMCTALAYLKAKGIAVATPGLSFDRRVQRFKEML